MPAAPARSHRWLRRLGTVLLGLVVIALGSFGLLQTPWGLDWLGRAVTRYASAPGFSIAIDGLRGLAPFRMHARHIAIGDGRGVWLSLDDAGFDLAPASLFNGKPRLRFVTAALVEVARLPETAPVTPPPTLAERLRQLRPSLAFAIDRLAITRLVLETPVLGERVEATVAGHAEETGAALRAGFDLHRIDGEAGSVRLTLAIAGAAPALDVELAASDPTGIVVDRLLGRSDRLPLSIVLSGRGPLADWHGRLAAAAGTLARFDAELSLQAGSDTALALSGIAAVARLLPADLAHIFGDRVPVSASARLGRTGAIAIERFSVEIAAGTVAGDAGFGRPDRALSAHLQVRLPDLASFGRYLAMPVAGLAQLRATVSGTEDRPILEIAATADGLRAAGGGAEHVQARLSLTSTADPADPTARFDITAEGRLQGVAVPAGLTLPPALGRDLDWSFAMNATRDGSAVHLTRLTAKGLGFDLALSGDCDEGGHRLAGQLRLVVADLRLLSGFFGRPVAGSVSLSANARQQSPDRIIAELDGALAGFDSGIPALDALAGKKLSIAVLARRDASGLLSLERLTLAGAGVNLTATGQFDPAARRVAASLAADLPRLDLLGSAFGTALSGRLEARANAAGDVDHVHAAAEIDGTSVGAGGARLDRLHLAAVLADLSQPRATLDGDFHGGGLDGKLSAEIDARNRAELVIPRLRLSAADGAIAASLRIARDGGQVRGAISGRVPDLSRWSRLAGVALAGSLDLTAGLGAGDGERLDLSVHGAGLAAGGAAARWTLGRLALTARLTDILGTPAGKAEALLTGVGFPSGELTQAKLSLDGRGAGRFAFAGDAKGKIVEQLTLALDGTAALASKERAIEIRIAHLGGSIGADRIELSRPLTLAKRGDDLQLADLDLRLGPGRISGNAARRGATLSLALQARDFPVASAGRLAGYREVGGQLDLDASLGGTLGAPRGRFALSGRQLRLSLPQRPHLPSLGLTLSGDWNGREVTLRGRATALKGEAITLTGSAPLLLAPAPIGISVPPGGRLALRVEGAGELANLADLLPLGEDRLTGHYTLDASVGGTPAAPAASGVLRIEGGRYQSFATGAVLTNMRLVLVGERDRFTLREFSAGDTAKGRLDARGGIVLAGGQPRADIAATLAGFRLAASDEAVAEASGTVAVAGPLASPAVTARLTVDRGDFTIPDTLPPSVTRLTVVEINRRSGRRPPAPRTSQPPALPASLDIALRLPGRSFVRGHGLDSEWRGELKIGGTSAAPQITGRLVAVRGTFGLLGRSFRVVRGTIAFDGGASLDPALDILAEASTADITAQIHLAGLVSAPKVSITSVPAVPQDEILARILFNRDTRRITAAEGIQVAQAAATLSGGGVGVLDRLRGRLGLDRLSLGSAPKGVAASNLNPAAGGSAAAGTAISGGKYVGEGVYVGATQGLTPQSSKVTVEVELRPHVTVETDMSQTGGSGLGLNYKYDY